MNSALQITIQDWKTARSLLKEDPERRHFPHVVSLGDPDSPAPPGLEGRNTLRIECHDIDWENEDLEGLTYPSAEHAAEIIEYGRALLRKAESDGATQRVLLHCQAGISRSTAAALILLRLDEARGNKIHETQDTRAINILLAERPQALPNRNLVRFADAILGSSLFELSEEIHRARIEALRQSIQELRDSR